MLDVLFSVNEHCTSDLKFSVKIEKLLEVVVSVNEPCANVYIWFILSTNIGIKTMVWLNFSNVYLFLFAVIKNLGYNAIKTEDKLNV